MMPTRHLQVFFLPRLPIDGRSHQLRLKRPDKNTLFQCFTDFRVILACPV